MTVWALIEKHGYTVATFRHQIDARQAQQWYREHYPHTTFSVMPRELIEVWIEPKNNKEKE